MVIATRPHGKPVTDRAIPTAIFAAEEAVKKTYLRKWLKDQSMTDFSLQSILDWDYYRTRLGNTIQKIISIPAAFQDVANPVPRVPLPEWMQRRFREKHNPFQQKALTDMFRPVEKPDDVAGALIDVEDLGGQGNPRKGMAAFVTRHAKVDTDAVVEEEDVEEEAEPEVIDLEEGGFEDWLKNRKARWKKLRKRMNTTSDAEAASRNTRHRHVFEKGTGQMMRSNGPSKSTLFHILEIQALDEPGIFSLWLVTPDGQSYKRVQIQVPKRFYLNCSEPVDHYGKKVSKTLPFGDEIEYLYEVEMSERRFHENKKDISTLLSDPKIKRVYEINISAMHRAITHLGCVVDIPKTLSLKNTIKMENLKSADATNYLDAVALRKFLFFYTTLRENGLMGLFALNENHVIHKAIVWIVDRKNKQRPNLTQLFDSLELGTLTLDCKIKTYAVDHLEQAHLGINRVLSKWHSNTTPSIIYAQSSLQRQRLREKITSLNDYPIVSYPFHSEDGVFPALTWKKVLSTNINH